MFFFILLFVFIILFLFPPPPLDPAKQSHGEKLIQNNNSIFFCVFRCDGLDGQGTGGYRKKKGRKSMMNKIKGTKKKEDIGR